MGEKPIHCYWNIRGLGQPVRLMLEYIGVDYEDKRLKTLDEWDQIKHSLGLDCPNVPYYIEGSLKLTQCMAILRHLGRKHGLAPKTDEERIRTDQAAVQFLDIRNSFCRLCYGEDFEERRPEFLRSLPRRLSELEAFLGDRDWLGGGKQPTFVDFYAYEILDHHRMFAPKMVSAHPVITSYLSRFESLPRIRAYMASDRFIASPINAVYAKWHK